MPFSNGKDLKRGEMVATNLAEVWILLPSLQTRVRSSLSFSKLRISKVAHSCLRFPLSRLTSGLGNIVTCNLGCFFFSYSEKTVNWKVFPINETESRQKLDNSTNVGKTRPRDKMKRCVKTFVDNTKDNIEKIQTCKFWINSQSFHFFSKELQNWLRVSQVEQVFD